MDQVERIRGCEDPIRLVGHTKTYDAASGELLHAFTSESLPHGQLLIPCGNRRASRCEPCSWLHQGDTDQLVVSGLAGGKGVPETVRDHPRVFVTLTAPSFGAVHRFDKKGAACRPRRSGVCQHGVPRGCGLVHEEKDHVVGTPLCAACYDYVDAVLFDAHAGALWHRFTDYLRITIASRQHIRRKHLREYLTVSYAKVAEYQRRGAVHFHAVIRLDGPDDAGSDPPAWASLELLTDVVRAAHEAASVATPESEAVGSWRLRFGAQLEVRPVLAFGGGEDLTERAVASYIAKYVTKGDVPGLLYDRPIRHASAIGLVPVSEHGRSLMRTCWRLGGLPEFKKLNLRTWTHQLGFRGHVTTKSRVYSTTYGNLRAARVSFQQSENGESNYDDIDTFTESRWAYAGHGYTDVEAMFAAEVADGVALRREVRADIRAEEGRQRDRSSSSAGGVPRSGEGGRVGHAIGVDPGGGL